MRETMRSDYNREDSEYRKVVALFGTSGIDSKILSVNRSLRDREPDAEWEIEKTPGGHVVSGRDMSGRIIYFEDFRDRTGLVKYFDILSGKGSYGRAVDFMSERAGKLVQGQSTFGSETWHEYAPNRYSEYTGLPVIMPHDKGYVVFIKGIENILSCKDAVAELLYENRYERFECFRMTTADKKDFLKKVERIIRLIRLQGDSKSMLDMFKNPINEYIAFPKNTKADVNYEKSTLHRFLHPEDEYTRQ